MDLPLQRQRANRICQALESCVHCTLTPICGAAALAVHSWRRPVPAFSISDFGMPFYGYLWATFVQSAFTSNIASPLFGQVTQMYGQINGEGFPSSFCLLTVGRLLTAS